MDEHQDQEVALRNNQQADYVDRLQPGYRFCPTDTEIIVNYLIPQIETGTHPPSRLHKVNIYDHPPEDLAKEYCPCDANWYFLTPRTRRCPNGKRPSRTVKGRVGHWHASQSSVLIYHDDPAVKKQVVVGKKTSLTYQQGRNNDKTPWLMHEYTTNDPNLPLDESGQDGTKLTEWVLCKIYMKPSENKKQIRGRVLNAAKNQDQAGGYDQQVQNQQQQPVVLDDDDQPSSPKRQRLSSHGSDQQSQVADPPQFHHEEVNNTSNNLSSTTNEQQLDLFQQWTLMPDSSNLLTGYPDNQPPIDDHVVQEYFHQDPTSILYTTTVDDQAPYHHDLQQNIEQTINICPQPQITNHVVCETPTLHQAFTTSDQVQHSINGGFSTVYHHGLQSSMSNNIADQYSSDDFYLTAPPTPQPTIDDAPYATTTTDHHHDDNATSPLTPPTSPPQPPRDYYTELMTMDPNSPSAPKFKVTEYWKDWVRKNLLSHRYPPTTIEYY